ncbi:DUF2752 domain-containing protein [Runella slithyformis]|uniref:DUF2752 domain-containing protein n=1 Tax=Runella slithyformis (strain ATCC 29530 / DSM 19594 / LMG 11500 / NCIMB 11436 / LSU 4) TaxID=761193 RepID=A0A7U3ZKT5_RUNSL|nr:DUF2752 domain-containing protein [Runella slithyformis]AEI49050.1 hypothetical protein Runsl_2650 [Runella slithyformis DSM 19594]
MFRKAVLTVTALALTVFYFYVDPAVHSFGPPCPVHYTTGWYCWGCGGQRAFHALLHGRFITAFHSNLLVYPVILVAAVFLYAELSDRPAARHWLRHRYVAAVVLTVFIAFTILRNLRGFEFLVPR